MEMTFRWYGSKFDTVTLEQIRQIPGVTGVITTLYDTTPGEVWTREAIHALKEEVEASGLHISTIECKSNDFRKPYDSYLYSHRTPSETWKENRVITEVC